MGNFTIWPPKRSKTYLVAFIVAFFVLATGLAGCIYEEDANENANTSTANENQAVNANQNTNTADENANTNATANENTNTTANANKSANANTNKSTTNTNQKVTAPTVTPTKVVNTYMKYTMGTIPGAEVDYEAAKEYLTQNMLDQFTDITFVPLSYCVQLGPDDVNVKSENIVGQMATVRVSGQYGTDDFTDMWNFSLVVQNNEWRIDEIECLLGY